MDLRAIADRTLPLPDKKSSFYKDGNTADIVQQVLDVYNSSHHQVAQFAPFLNAGSVYATCSVIWHFVKANIRYKVDPPGVQWVKTPARVWADKLCDCKSYSIFIAACLQALGIKGALRFVSFLPDDPQPTHVYVVVNNGGREIKLDCVLGQFDYEKPYAHKQDYNMSRIYRLSGIGNTPGMSLPVEPSGVIDPQKLSAAILKERLELEKEIYRRRGATVSGIGTVLQVHDYYIGQLETYLRTPGAPSPFKVAGIMDDLALLPNPQELSAAERQETYLQILAEYGIEKNNTSQKGADFINMLSPGYRPVNVEEQAAAVFPDIMAAKGNLEKRLALLSAKLQAIGYNVTLKRINKTGFAGVLQAAGNIAKGVLKVVTAPVRLLAKGILEITLPKAAPNFIYLFITDPKIIAKLPTAVKAKRDKQQRKADFITEVIGMGKDHFMGIVRNGIMKHVGASPEDYIAQELKKIGISGIGAVPAFVAVAKVGPALIGLLKKLFSIFKKKEANEDEDVSAAPEDWPGMGPEQQGMLATAIANQKGNTTAIDKIVNSLDKANEILQIVKPAVDQSKNQNVTDVQMQNPGYSGYGSDGYGYTDNNVVFNSDGSEYSQPNKDMAEVVVSTNKKPAEPPAKDNTMLYLGLGALAILALKK